MAIPESFINQLKMSCDIESVISTYFTLKRAGRNIKGLCPFHSERTPSFTVYNDTQSYYCFGCGAGGDVINFIKNIENVDYVEAVKILAGRVGLTLPEDGVDDRVARLRQQVYAINRETARYFNSILHTAEGKAGLDYYIQRGLTKKTITSYGLGFAPSGWDNLKNHLLQKGFKLFEMEAAAVITKGKNDSYYDKFRNRVMFPIIDLRGNVIAFSGRVLDDSKPKYINSNDTPVYKKSKTLFSLNFAKSDNDGKIILSEGNLDVVALHQAGFRNAVASCGTALTSEQARLMAQYADEVIIAYDSDEAGQIATKKASRLLDETGVKIKVLSMKGAKDPDEYITKFGATRFKALIDHSASVTDFQMDKIKGQYDITTAEGKVAFLNEAVKYLTTLANPLEREVYAGKLAEQLEISRTAITAQVDTFIKKNRRKSRENEWRTIEQNKEVYSDRINPQRAKNLKESKAEEAIIVCLFKNPDLYDEISKKIREEDFVTDFNRRVLGMFYENLQNNIAPSLSLLADKLSSEEIGRVSGMLAKTDGVENSVSEIDTYINILLQHKNEITPERVKEMSPEELFNTIKNNRNKR